MLNLNQWAIRHGVSYAALAELRAAWGETASTEPAMDGAGDSEAAVASEFRLRAAEAGWLVYRNNVGALPDERGRIVRYGLANESKQQNAALKSSDFICSAPVVITSSMVGQVIGQFAAVETKERGWNYTGKGREVAQLAFGQGVLVHGGSFRFYTGGAL